MSKAGAGNINEASITLGYSVPTITKYIAEGMPVKSKGGRGRDYILVFADCFKWIYEKGINNAVGDTTQADTKELKKRKLAAETGLAEIEYSQKRKEVVAVTEVARLLMLEALAVKAKLRAIPARIDHVLVALTNQTKLREILLDAIDEALEELATGAHFDEPATTKTPKKRRKKQVEPAAKTKTKRVGRAKSKNTRGKRKTGKA